MIILLENYSHSFATTCSEKENVQNDAGESNLGKSDSVLSASKRSTTLGYALRECSAASSSTSDLLSTIRQRRENENLDWRLPADAEQDKLKLHR